MVEQLLCSHAILRPPLQHGPYKLEELFLLFTTLPVFFVFQGTAHWDWKVANPMA